MSSLALIVAVADNGVIGHQGRMPWHLPADLRYFKSVTQGHPVLMGRKTHESIGRPLPGRRNVVITRNPQWSAEGVETAGSLPTALALVKEAPEAFLIGGGELYAQALTAGLVQRIYLTRVHMKPEGDTYFPLHHLRELGFRLQESTPHSADEANACDMTFEVWAR
ncbi:MAG: dihydrofolate reductase [Bacteroidetes bacterium]|nr:dihydrofolate reductase [Bacteroidota bacterium]